jgi:hypothetical protein
VPTAFSLVQCIGWATSEIVIVAEAITGELATSISGPL